MHIKKKIKITIVTVVLNAQDTIVETIKSVIRQNFKDFEYIVVDGNSSDFTKNCIYQFRKNIAKIIIQKDKGIYNAMNLAVKHSSGEWIFFLNSGDKFYNDKVLSNIFNKIYFQKIIYGNVIKSYKNFSIIWNGKDFNKNTFAMPFSHQSTFVKTELLRKNLFSIEYKIISDFIFFYRCLSKNLKFKKVNKNISIVSTVGISNKKRLSSIIESIQFFFNIKKYYVVINLFIFFIYQVCVSFFKIIIHKKMIDSFIKKNNFIL
jgi:glycosyltransferase involved in cell wall biosynthesis